MEKTKKCPHCNGKSVRRWLHNGYVKCLDCDKISKYSDWKEDEETEYVDMHDALEEYLKAASFMKIENPKVFTSKKCPVCGLIHSEVMNKRRYAILIIFYHFRAAFLFYLTHKKIERGFKRQAKGKKSIREKIWRRKLRKSLGELN